MVGNVNARYKKAAFLLGEKLHFFQEKYCLSILHDHSNFIFIGFITDIIIYHNTMHILTNLLLYFYKEKWPKRNMKEGNIIEEWHKFNEKFY